MQYIFEFLKKIVNNNHEQFDYEEGVINQSNIEQTQVKIDDYNSHMQYEQQDQNNIEIPPNAIETICKTIDEYKHLIQSLDKSDPSRLIYSEIILSLQSKLAELSVGIQSPEKERPESPQRSPDQPLDTINDRETNAFEIQNVNNILE